MLFKSLLFFRKRIATMFLGTIMAFTAASQQGNPFCGEFAIGAFPDGGDFFDCFGNGYTATDLDAFQYPQDVVLQGCNSGIFDVQFGVMGNAPAWTLDEMLTVCAAFNYASSLVSAGNNNNPISIRVTKDNACTSDGAGSPIWESDCGIVNSVIFDQIVSGVNNYPLGFISGSCLHTP
jgi:hypothetical protein